MNIAAWALKRQPLVLLILVAALIGGVGAAQMLPSGIYPEVEFPRIAVVARQGSAPPQLFQTTVTRPLEQSLLTVLGVQRVRSRTIRGGAEINMLMAPETNMWLALQLVQAQLNDVRSLLPADAEIRVERVTPVSFPVLSFNLTGPYDGRTLRDLTDQVVRPALAKVPGVGRIHVEGGDVREVEVLVDPRRASAGHLRIQDIAARVGAALPLLSVGRYNEDRALVTVMASGEATGLDDLKSVPVGLDGQGVPVALATVATVEEGAEDRLYRVQGRQGETVLMTVARLEGASTPNVTARVIAEMDAIKGFLPSGIVVEPVYDQGLLVREALASVRDAVLLGIVLCIIGLGLFLRNVRAGLVAALAVPITLVITFLAMRLMNQTLNLMSMGGMAVAVGLVVDDAIIIVEAISHRQEQGMRGRDAVIAGTHELSAAVFGTTVTTVIVCLPLVWVSGVVGKFFTALALTLSAAVVISLIVSLVVVPITAVHLLRPMPARPIGILAQRYGSFIRRHAQRRLIGPVTCALAIAFLVVALAHVPTGFLPSTDEGAFVLDYFAPAGTSLDEMEAVLHRVEDILRATPEIETFSRRTGAGLDPTAATLVSHGDIMVRLHSGPRRHWQLIVAQLRQLIEANVPQVRVEFTQVLQDMLNDLSGAPRPIELKLFGPDYAVLEHLAQSLAAELRPIDGLVDLYDGVEGASPELVARINRDSAARLGLSADDVAQSLNDALRGVVVGTMRRFDRLINIRVRYPDEVRFDHAQIANLPFAFAGPRIIGMAEVTSMHRDSSPTVLLHEGVQPVVIITGDHETRDLGAVVRDIESVLKRKTLPQGYRYELGGQYEGQQATMRNLSLVVAAGLLLVLVVLVAQFGSLRPALAILFTTPLALVGALGTLWLTQIPLNASSLMGCVLLVGLVVKNGILLLEVAEEGSHGGQPYVEALALAGERRIRPIAMTTTATIAGLLPLALGMGAGAELQRPLALAVIGGLLVSTVLCLAILPSLALLLRRRETS